MLVGYWCCWVRRSIRVTVVYRSPAPSLHPFRGNGCTSRDALRRLISKHCSQQLLKRRHFLRTELRHRMVLSLPMKSNRSASGQEYGAWARCISVFHEPPSWKRSVLRYHQSHSRFESQGTISAIVWSWSLLCTEKMLVEEKCGDMFWKCVNRGERELIFLEALMPRNVIC